MRFGSRSHPASFVEAFVLAGAVVEGPLARYNGRPLLERSTRLASVAHVFHQLSR
jgi:hypothetical protein